MVFALTLASAVLAHSLNFIRPVNADSVSARPATTAGAGGASHPDPKSSAADPADDDGFSMLIASDPQLTWWRGGEDEECQGICSDVVGRLTNEYMVSAMNDIMSLGQWPAAPGLKFGAGAPLVEPSGVIVNGDLTSFWHKSEAELYKDTYSDLRYQLYPGLGNHDYGNNKDGDKKDDGCVYEPLYHPDANRCAKEALWYMANFIEGEIPNVVGKDLTGFVAVENRGGYEARFEVEYELEDGSSKTKKSGHFPVLQWRTVVIPKEARNIEIKLVENSGVLWEGDNGWVTVDKYKFSRPTAACYRMTGTTLHPNSSRRGCPREWPSGSEGSLAYSYDIENYHFVQLQLRPNETADLPERETVGETLTFGFDYHSPSFEVTQSYAWLKDDLAAATAAGKFAVINMHDATDQNIRNDESFKEAIRGQNVVAIFAGHIHQDYGEVAWNKLSKEDYGIPYDVPVILSGSAECQRFLYAEFHRKYFNVAVIDSSGGQPAFVTSPSDVCDTRPSMASTKYSSNSGNPAPKTFTVNKAPTSVSGSLQTSPAREGAGLSFRAEGTDPDGDALTYHWDFGDGTAATGETPQHAYADNGTYNVVVTADDGYEGLLSSTFQVTVDNVAPAITASGAVIDENQAATVTGVITDPGAVDSFTLFVDWGEGPPQTVSVPAGSTSYSISHTYLDDNPTATPSDSYPVQVTITDKDSGQGATGTGVTVKNLNPAVRIDRLVDEAGEEVGAADVVLVGLPVTAYESYSDPGILDTRTASRSWGDATPAENLGAVTNATSGSHTYTAPGTYQLAATVTDDDTGAGGTGRAVQVVTPSAATAAAIDVLSQTTSSRPAAAAEITAALASLQGQNGGSARNGALDKLQQGAHQAALQKMEQSIRHQEAAEIADPALSFTKLKSLTALTAKSVAVDAVNRAEARASNSGQRKQVEAAKSLLSQGQSLLNRRNYTGAVDSFSKSLGKTQFAGGHPAATSFNVMGLEPPRYDPINGSLSKNSNAALVLGRRNRHYAFNLGT
jgi:PKD repeat protein